MTARKVAHVFAYKEDTALSHILLEGGWQSEYCNVVGHLSRKSAFRDCHVGIACMAMSDPAWLAKVCETAASHSRIPWIAVVGRGLIDREPIREFVAIHCVDYQTTPLDRERFLATLGHAAGMAQLVAPDRGLLQSSSEPWTIVGHSLAMQSLRHDLAKIAAVDAPVLITGETGTGKELVARTIHQLSRRHDRPFVAINCVSLPPSLIHAELFGFEKGAFTGAHQRKVGHFEAARGGTIFLDEIGDLHPDLQALLLRFLEEQAVRRVGGREQIHIDARVLAATNVDLEAAVRLGRFREDLYYRLNVLRVGTPPLRERREDIDVLALTFLNRYVGEKQTRLRGFTRPALTALRAHSWPGNVRELLNRVRRAIVMTEGTLITPLDLRLGVDAAGRPMPSLDAARREAERRTILAALQRTGWSASKSADLIGVSRATFYRLLDRHGLTAEDSPARLVPEATIPPKSPQETRA